MGASKTEIYSQPINRLAELSKALGHPARIAILQILIKESSCICRDLVNDIGLSQPTISQHLKALRDVGIIKGSVEGPKVCYCLDLKTVKELKESLLDFTDKALDSITNCC